MKIGQKINSTKTASTRFLIYGVNPGEGFNLRRDVYVRVANLVKHLREIGEDFVLVLPPWRHLYHWRSNREQNGMEWKTFFDVDQLNRYVPVIEFNDFVHLNNGDAGIDLIAYLQRHPDGFKNGWEEKIEEAKCTNEPVYWKDSDNKYLGNFWGLGHIYGRDFKCISVQGTAKILTEFLQKSTARSVFVDRFEEVLHSNYGESEFWQARRSMVFAKSLREKADQFRRDYLNSSDAIDQTPYNDRNWREQIPKDGKAKGGDYLSVHMRRGDFVFSGREGVPSIKAVKKQIRHLLKKLKLDKVFLATDGSEKEVEELSFKLKATVFRYRPSSAEINKFGDGGIAIIDQWIAAHGHYFIGSCQSTFSFRIHEERDILGFDPDLTFNCLCPDKEIDKCEQPTRWRVQFT
eukprot:gene3480-3978_t